MFGGRILSTDTGNSGNVKTKREIGVVTLRKEVLVVIGGTLMQVTYKETQQKQEPYGEKGTEENMVRKILKRETDGHVKTIGKESGGEFLTTNFTKIRSRKRKIKKIQYI